MTIATISDFRVRVSSRIVLRPWAWAWLCQPLPTLCRRHALEALTQPLFALFRKPLEAPEILPQTRALRRTQTLPRGVALANARSALGRQGLPPLESGTCARFLLGRHGAPTRCPVGESASPGRFDLRPAVFKTRQHVALFVALI